MALRFGRRDVGVDTLWAIIAWCWLSVFNFRLPGLHRDEAWAILRTHSIASGERPWNGMNAYTGALYEYLYVPWAAFFGYGATSLRTFTALLFAGVLFLLLRSLRRLGCSTRFRVSASILFVSHPLIFAFARTGFEVTSINFFLGVLSLYLLATAKRPYAFFIAGILQGLAIWSHVLYAAFTMATLVTWASARAIRAWQRPRTLGRTAADALAILIGLLAGASIRLYDHFFLQPNGGDLHVAWIDRLQRQWIAFADDLPSLPQALLRLWEGPFVFKRYTGTSPKVYVPLLSILFGIVLGIRIYRRVFWRETFHLVDGLAVLLFSLTTMGFAFMVPQWSDRYFEMPIAIALFSFLFACATLEKSSSALLRRYAFVLPSMGALSCSALLAVYFVQPFFSRGGGSLAFGVGHRLEETSSHFVDAEPIRRFLVASDVRAVYLEHFLRLPFDVYELERPALSLAEDFAPTDALPSVRQSTAFVVYRHAMKDGKALVLDRRMRDRYEPSRIVEMIVSNPNVLIWIVRPTTPTVLENGSASLALFNGRKAKK